MSPVAPWCVTPNYGIEGNKTEVTGRVIFDKEGDIKSEIGIADYGIRMDRGFYVSKMDHKEMSDFINGNLLASFDRLEVLDQSVSFDMADRKSLQTYSFNAVQYGEVAGDYLLFKSALFPPRITSFKKR